MDVRIENSWKRSLKGEFEKEYFVPYKDLTEEIKEYDREWARKIIKVVEKHYTLDRSMTGSGHFFAVDPKSLKTNLLLPLWAKK